MKDQKYYLRNCVQCKYFFRNKKEEGFCGYHVNTYETYATCLNAQSTACKNFEWSGASHKNSLHRRLQQAEGRVHKAEVAAKKMRLRFEIMREGLNWPDMEYFKQYKDDDVTIDHRLLVDEMIEKCKIMHRRIQRIEGISEKNRNAFEKIKEKFTKIKEIID